MSQSVTAKPQTLIPKKGWKRVWHNFKLHWQLHLMLLFPIGYLLLFDYGPMYGVQIAWKDYSPRAGIWGSPWVGWVNFTKFFQYRLWYQLIWNTLALSLYELLTFPVPIILALIMHVHTGKFLKKLSTNTLYIPHFISLVVMVGILNTLLNPVSGLLGAFYRMLGNYAYDDIRGSKDAFRHLYIWSGVWKGMGWGTIIYMSALSGVSEELHEAAKLDGASRFQRVLHIDLPTLIPLISLKLILEFGSIMSVGYQKAYLMQNEMNLEVSELISTYVYKQGVQKANMSFGSAVGLMQSAINTVLIFTVNKIANLLSDGELGLF